MIFLVRYSKRAHFLFWTGLTTICHRQVIDNTKKTVSEIKLNDPCDSGYSLHQGQDFVKYSRQTRAKLCPRSMSAPHEPLCKKKPFKNACFHATQPLQKTVSAAGSVQKKAELRWSQKFYNLELWMSAEIYYKTVVSQDSNIVVLKTKTLT